MNELEALKRKERLTSEDRKRIKQLSPKRIKASNKPIKGTTPLWMALDKVHTKFNGPMYIWTKVSCTKCKEWYHLGDGAKCECGLEESKERFNYHLGEVKNGSI